MKVERAELQLTEDNNEFFSGSFLSERDGEQEGTQEKQSGTLGFRCPRGSAPQYKPYRPGTHRTVCMRVESEQEVWSE